MLAARRKPGIDQQPPQPLKRKVEQVSRQIEMEPGRIRPPRLETAVIGNGDDEPPFRLQNAADFSERPPRIEDVLGHVPDDHLVEPLGRITGLVELGGARIWARGSAPAAAAALISKP